MRIKLLKAIYRHYDVDDQYITDFLVKDETPWTEISKETLEAIQAWVNHNGPYSREYKYILIIEEPSLLETAIEGGNKILKMRAAVEATQKEKEKQRKAKKRTQEQKEREQLAKLQQKYSR